MKVKGLIYIIVIVVLCINNQNLQSQVPSNYPEFSWDHVPQYLFVRKAAAYNQAELEYISTFPIVTLAQTTGMDSYGSTEKGSLEVAKALKSINPNTKIIYYWNTLIHYQFYDTDKELNAVNQAFLKDSLGNTNLHLGKRPFFDLTNDIVRKWWVDHVVQMSKNDEIDGVFFDAIGKIVTKYLQPIIGEEKRQKVVYGYKAMMRDCQLRMDASKIKIANLIRANFPNQGLDELSHFHGSYLEHFDRDTDWTASSIEATQTAARAGKIICATFDIGDEFPDISELAVVDDYIDTNEELQDRFEYCLALFLVCAEKYSYFYFHDGYSVNGWSNNRFWMKRFVEFDKPLGAPLGSAIKNGVVYTREFKNVSVWVDIEQKNAKIEWK